MKLLFSTLFLTATVVSAVPAPAASSCNTGLVRVVKDILKVLPKGTPFCSTYLSIPTVTSTFSKTVATTTQYTSTSTSTNTVISDVTSTLIIPQTITTTTGTDFITDVVTQTATSTLVVSTNSVSSIVITSNAPTPTSTATVTTTLSQTFYSLYPLPAVKARNELDERAITIPTQIIQYAKPVISSACACLNIPTSTVTTTASVTHTVLAVATASADVTATNSVEVTSTQTVYSDVAASTTVEATTVLTDTVTTTTTLVSSETIVTTITPATSIVTATSTVTSATTVTTDPCDPTNGVQYSQEVYNFAGILHSGYITGSDDQYWANQGHDVSPAGCCRICMNKPGCVVGISLQGGSGCFIGRNNIKPVVGANAQCPNGYDVIDSFFQRSVGLPSVNNGYAFTLGPCFAGTVAP